MVSTGQSMKANETPQLHTRLFICLQAHSCPSGHEKKKIF
jgi:hypothetical protein